MAWYNPRTWGKTSEKENPAQDIIATQEGSAIYSTQRISYLDAFNKLESVNRGTSLIVRACAGLDFDVKEKVMTGRVPGVRTTAVNVLLNFKPNPYQSTQEFRQNIFTDFILEGNIFIYYDGTYLYHLPAAKVQVDPDTKTFVNKYIYNGTQEFNPDSIIHIKDLSSNTIYRGESRLQSAYRSINTLWKMQAFQDQFFDNGAVPGLVLTTDNTLSQIAKDKTTSSWSRQYNPKNGARRPMILDSGMKPFVGLTSTFQEMDFDTSIKTHDEKILKALGVPPLLLDSGNNANISPNLRLFYLETIMPIINAYASALERYFGYDIAPVISNVSALQPEEKDRAASITTLVNGGIMTPNEARVLMRLPLDTDPQSNKLRIPANIAGSAADPSQGGAPKKPPAKEV